MSHLEEIDHAIRGVLGDVIADEFIERVATRVRDIVEDHDRNVAWRLRQPSTAPSGARLVDVNFNPVGGIAEWAAGHAQSVGVRLPWPAVTLIYETPDHDRSSVTLDEHRRTGAISEEM